MLLPREQFVQSGVNRAASARRKTALPRSGKLAPLFPTGIRAHVFHRSLIEQAGDLGHDRLTRLARHVGPRDRFPKSLSTLLVTRDTNDRVQSDMLFPRVAVSKTEGNANMASFEIDQGRGL